MVLVLVDAFLLNCSLAAAPVDAAPIQRVVRKSL